MVAQLDSLYLRTRPWKGLARLLSYALFEGRPVSTRGRWINPFVFLFLRTVKRLPQLRKVDRPIFVIGIGRSGTTALGKVISMHREVGFLNEPKALWQVVHPNDDLIGNYSRGTAVYRLGAEQATEEAKQAAKRLYGAYLAISRTGRVLDKYPEMIFRFHFIRALFPDARFLLLIRNGWDVCSSIDRWSERHANENGTESHSWWGVDYRKWNLLVDQLVHSDLEFSEMTSSIWNAFRGPDMAAVEWTLTMREALSLLSEHTESVFPVRFERLSGDPTSILPEVLDFCELSQDQVLHEYAARTLHPLPSRGSVRLHESVRPMFEATMGELGYL